MILSPMLRVQLRPKLCCWLKQSRNIRPNMKIGKEKFELQLDVRNFNKDEIRVKAQPDYVIIEGKQQKQTKRGLVMRQFVRKFRLPTGCIINVMQSKLSPDGILTITAPRKICDANLPCEMQIPISPELPSTDVDAAFVPVDDNVVKSATSKYDACAAYMKGKHPKVPKAGDDKPPGSDQKPK